MKFFTRGKIRWAFSITVFIVVCIVVTMYLAIRWHGSSRIYEIYKQNLQQIEHLKADVPEIKEYISLFPGYAEFLNQEGGLVTAIEPGYKAVWTFDTIYCSHYMVRLHVNIMCDEYKTEAVFSRCAVARLTPIESSKIDGNIYSLQDIHTLDLDDWKKLVNAKGDFSVLDLDLTTDCPSLSPSN